jgi:hypothetical protein
LLLPPQALLKCLPAKGRPLGARHRKLLLKSLLHQLLLLLLLTRLPHLIKLLPEAQLGRRLLVLVLQASLPLDLVLILLQPLETRQPHLLLALLHLPEQQTRHSH